MHIILIGFKNCGKTSVGKALAAKLKLPFVDTDDCVQQEYYELTKKNLNIREIYQTEGESYFRMLEKKMISKLNHFQESIIAVGGGSILDAENRKQLKKSGKLVYLTLPYEDILERTATFPAFVDSEQPELSFKNIYTERKPIYEELADHTLDAKNKSIDAIADEIISWMKDMNAEDEKGIKNNGQQ